MLGLLFLQLFWPQREFWFNDSCFGHDLAMVVELDFGLNAVCGIDPSRSVIYIFATSPCIARRWGIICVRF